MLRIIGVLLLIPLLDAMLLVVVAGRIGAVPTIALVVLTALIGMLLVRAEGRHTLRKIQSKVAQGDVPTDELIDGGLLLISGTLLLTPGLVTDFVGFLLVIPFTRYPVRLATKKWVVTPYVDAKTSGFATGNVYIGGFPGGEGQGPQGQGGPEDTYDVDGDAYDVDDDTE